MNILDPMEIRDNKIEKLANEYIDENTCMQCKKKVDYELYCMSITGDGPALCGECAGINT